jgi:hypothetical protein
MHSEPQVVLPQAASALAAAAGQITLALQESQPPVEQLGSSVGRIIMTLSTIRKAAELRGDPGSDDPFRAQISGAVAELGRHAAEATMTLQFYDRLTQHLTHLHDYLAGVGELLGRSRERAFAGSDTSESAHPREWEELRERLCRRLISDAQRQCLNGEPVLEQRDSSQSVELF